MRSFMTIACYFAYIYFVDKFCKKYLEVTPIKEKIFVSFLFFGRIFINVIYKCSFMPNIILSLLNNIFFILFIMILFRGEREKKLLIASMLITITTLTENFFVSFFSCLTLFYLHTIKNVSIPILEEWENKWIFYTSWVIVILAVYLITKYSASIFYYKTKKWYMILAIPILVITLIIDVANWGASNGILVRSGGNMSLYYDQIFSYIEFCILTFLSMFAAGFYIFGMNKIYLEQEKSNQYHSQIAAYKMLEEQYRQSERLRHDLKNHVLALFGLLENRELEAMKNYLNTMESSADLGVSDDITENRVVNVVIGQKRKTAERKNFIWECDVQLPQICCMNEFDLCVLFGNILDNAVEACERLQDSKLIGNKQPFINIQSRIVKKCLLLEVKNSTNTNNKQNIDFNNKKNTVKHGIGLLNVRDVVHKYNGIINIEIQNGIFVVSVLIPLNNTAKTEL